MGVMLIAAMAAGGVAGLVIGMTFVLLAVGLTRKTAARRSRVWPVFIGTSLLLALVLLHLVSLIPQAPVKPGSDYDIAMGNYFWTALRMLAAPGLAALLAMPATLLCPRKPVPAEPPLLA